MTQKGERQKQIYPLRKTPRVRPASVASDIKIAGHKNSSEEIDTDSVPTKAKMSTNTRTAVLMLGAFLLGSMGTYVFTSNSNTAPVTFTSTFTEVIAGKVALTESELIAAVKKTGLEIYWAGPVNGAKYTLSIPADGQAYVRYLPNGDGLSDTKPNYVVIATYTTVDAFTTTQSAGNQSNGVVFINRQNAVVYYSKSMPTNVYVAYPDSKYQIEIFDPLAAGALDIASKQGALRLVQ